jgi:predicted unusual protein kinase regulating ubiquinone biosynthesis (AarF/ABC1/UbiB family)
MKLSLSADHLKRYRQIAALLWKYGRSDLVQQLGADEEFINEARAETPADAVPEQLADELEAMGPTFVKLGQVLASRPDFLPEAYVRALSRLHDKVRPFPFAEVEQIVTQELGVRISKAFSRFDVEPLAAASLGQVHLAALRNGRQVVVKVQRPGIADQIAEDFEVLSRIAEFLDEHTEAGRRYRFLNILEEFRITLQQELNYEREAQNLVALGRNLAEFELISVPQPVADYTTRRVLTMDHVQGRKITALGPLARLENDGSALAEHLFKSYLKQVLVDGLFHADPHPGNVFLTQDGRIALLDLGMVGHATPAMQENLMKLLVAVSEGKADDAGNIVIHMGETREDFDEASFQRRIAQLIVSKQDEGLQQMNIGSSLLRVSRIAAESGLYVPSELTLLGKTLLQLDEVGRVLDPQFDPNACVRRNVAEMMSQRMQKNVTQGNAFKSLLEMKDFIAGLPSRLSDILDALVHARMEVRVKAVDVDTFMEGLQKIANRITTGLILAALIIGASLLMRVETSFRIFDYPGLAMLCFLGAAGGGLWLVVSILATDRRKQRQH